MRGTVAGAQLAEMETSTHKYVRPVGESTISGRETSNMGVGHSRESHGSFWGWAFQAGSLTVVWAWSSHGGGVSGVGHSM